MKKTIAVLLLLALAAPAGAVTWTSAKGVGKHVLYASAASGLTDGQEVTVKGRGYSTKVGIYVTFCVIPAKGQVPSACGPFDITGQSNDSVWVSSNPPVYAALLVKPFSKKGSFQVKIRVHRMIGNFDCKVVKCAILTRADHTKTSYRKADVFIPATFK